MRQLKGQAEMLKKAGMWRKSKGKQRQIDFVGVVQQRHLLDKMAWEFEIINNIDLNKVESK